MTIIATQMRSTVLVAMLYLSGLPGLTAKVSAQSPTTATMSGVVFDSIAMGPLAGARVAVIGTRAVGESDAQGRYRLTGVPPGSYRVSFFHPRLQDLGVGTPSQQVTFVAGAALDVNLSVPSEETLLMSWCLSEVPQPGFAVLAGSVTDSLTGVPMPRAVVRAERPVDASGRRAEAIEVRTDDLGYFRMCSVPPGAELQLRARYGEYTANPVRVTLEPGSAQIQDLALLVLTPGVLSGYVRDYISGEAIAGATVSVLGTESATLTDLTGRFVLAELPPGRHLLTTEHLAFEERLDSVTVFSEETVDIEVRMATEALEVEGLIVTARTRFGRTTRADAGRRADLVTREEIELLLPRVTNTVDVLRSMNTPGLSIREVYALDQFTGVMVPSNCIEVSRRAGGEGCRPAAVVVNGALMRFPDQVLRDLDPRSIESVEVLGPADAQFQFGAPAGNGAVLIETR